jgi:serine protease inhibitor
MLLFLVTICLLALTAYGSQPPVCSSNDVASQQLLSADTNRFGFRLFNQAVQGLGQKNVILSPTASFAFGMLEAGANGNSATQLQQLLFPSTTKAKANAGYSTLLAGLNSKTAGATYELYTANRIFLDRQFTPLKSYLAVTKKCFKSSTEDVDFVTKPNPSRIHINKWVSNTTKDKINDLLPSGSVNPLTKLVLVNAIYFKSQWKLQFKPENTRPSPFQDWTGNRRARTPLMRQQFSGLQPADHPLFPYHETAHVQAVEIPYVGEEVTMQIYLPKAAAAYQTFERTLTWDTVKNLQVQLKPTRLGVLGIPKWKVDFGLNLIPAFQALGVTDVFSTSKSDLSGINGKRDLYVSGAFHKAFVEINEEGTEAAAATAIVVATRSGGPGRTLPRFIANRPFLYIIWHKKTATALFIGRYVVPQT